MFDFNEVLESPEYQNAKPKAQLEVEALLAENFWTELTSDPGWTAKPQEEKGEYRTEFLKTFKTAPDVLNKFEGRDLGGILGSSSDELVERNFNPANERSFATNVWNLTVAGGKSALANAQTADDVATGRFDEDTAQTLSESINAQKKLNSLGGKPNELIAAERAMAPGAKRLEDAEGFVENAKALGGLAGDMAKEVVTNPKGMAYGTALNLGNMVPGLLGAQAGARTGALTGNPVIAAVGGVVGSFMGNWGINASAEFNHIVSTELNKRRLDPTPESIASLLSDDGFVKSALEASRDKGTGTAMIDSAFAFGAGRTATAPVRAARQQALATLGEGAAKEAIEQETKVILAAKGISQRVKQGAKAYGIELVSEPSSEAAGQLYGRGILNYEEVANEALFGIGGAAMQVPADAAAFGQNFIQPKPTPKDIIAAPDIDTAIDTFTESVKSIDTKIAGIDERVKGAGILSSPVVDPITGQTNTQGKTDDTIRAAGNSVAGSGIPQDGGLAAGGGIERQDDTDAGFNDSRFETGIERGAVRDYQIQNGTAATGNAEGVLGERGGSEGSLTLSPYDTWKANLAIQDNARSFEQNRQSTPEETVNTLSNAPLSEVEQSLQRREDAASLMGTTPVIPPDLSPTLDRRGQAEEAFMRLPPDDGKKPSPVDNLLPAFDSMLDEVKQGNLSKSYQNKEGETSPTVSSYPDWYKQETVTAYNKKYGTTVKLDRPIIAAVIKKTKEGKPLTDRQAGVFSYMEEVAGQKLNTDPGLIAGPVFDKLNKEGFEINAPQDISTGSLKPGDEAVIEKNGVPDKLVHQGFDRAGNAILKDGQTLHVDPFAQIQIIGQKSGKSKISPAEENFLVGMVGKIREIGNEQDVDRIAGEIEPYFEQNPHLSPYREMVAGAVEGRRNELAKAQEVNNDQRREVENDQSSEQTSTDQRREDEGDIRQLAQDRVRGNDQPAQAADNGRDGAAIGTEIEQSPIAAVTPNLRPENTRDEEVVGGKDAEVIVSTISSRVYSVFEKSRAAIYKGKSSKASVNLDQLSKATGIPARDLDVIVGLGYMAALGGKDDVIASVRSGIEKYIARESGNGKESKIIDGGAIHGNAGIQSVDREIKDGDAEAVPGAYTQTGRVEQEVSAAEPVSNPDVLAGKESADAAEVANEGRPGIPAQGMEKEALLPASVKAPSVSAVGGGPTADTGAFDSAAYDKQWKAKIAASRSSGAVHADSLPFSVEGLRGQRIKHAITGEVGVITAATSNGEVNVIWEQYPQSPSMAGYHASIPRKDLAEHIVLGRPGVKLNRKTGEYQILPDKPTAKKPAVSSDKSVTPTKQPSNETPSQVAAKVSPSISYDGEGIGLHSFTIQDGPGKGASFSVAAEGFSKEGVRAAYDKVAGNFGEKNEVKLPISKSSKDIYEKGFWQDLRDRRGQPYGTDELIAALSAIDKKTGRRTGFSIGGQGWKDKALEAVRWENDLAGESGYVSAGQWHKDANGERFFEVSFIPNSLVDDKFSNIHDRRHTFKNSVVQVSFTDKGNGEYEVGIGGPKNNGPAYNLLKENGRIEDLEGLEYAKAILSDPSEDLREILRESVRRLAISLGETPSVVISFRETGASIGVARRRTYTPEQIEAKFSKTTSDAGISSLTQSQSKAALSQSGEYGEEINPYGFKEHYGQAELAAELENDLNGRYEIIPWNMPDALVRRDKKGRVNMGGVPKSDFELSERLAKIFGKKIVWASIGQNFKINGLMHPGNDALADYIFIDPRAPLTSTVVYGHELSHWLQTEHPQKYQDLFDIVSPLIKGVDRYRDRLKLAQDDDGIKREIIADLLGDSFIDPSFWQEVAAESPSKFRQIANKVRQWINDLIGKMTLRGYGADQYVTDLKATRKALADLVRKTTSEQGRAELDGMKTGVLFAQGSRSGINDFAQDVMMSVKAAGRKIQSMAAFERWFAGSKVVGENGEPLVMYHGTNVDISKFGNDPERFLQGHYFTKTPGYAQVYAEQKAKTGGNPSMYPVYISMRNPLVIDGTIFNPSGVKGAIAKVLFPSKYKEAEAKSKFANDSYSSMSLSRRDIDELKTLGYDGVINKVHDEVIAFDSTQIKSIFNAKWDATNPDILKSFTEPKATSQDRAKEMKDGQAAEDVLISQEGSGVAADEVGPEFKAVDIDSAEFKRWAGDSVVTDKDDKPLSINGLYVKSDKTPPPKPKGYKTGVKLREEILKNKEIDENDREAVLAEAWKQSPDIVGPWTNRPGPHTDPSEQGEAEFFLSGLYGLDEPKLVVARRLGGVPEVGYSWNKANGEYESGISVIDILTPENQGTEYWQYDGLLGNRDNLWVWGYALDNDAFYGGDGEHLLASARVFSKANTPNVKSAISNTGEFSTSDPRIMYSTGASSAAPNSEEAYAQNRAYAVDRKAEAIRTAKSIGRQLVGGMDKFMGSISTRLANINPKLRAKVRELDFKIGTGLKKDIQSVQGLLIKAKKMSRADFADWDLARKNSDVDKINELVAKYGLEKEYADYRETLKRIREEAIAVGRDVGFIEDYAPRIIKDHPGFLEATGRGPDRGRITEALRKRAEEMGTTVGKMSIEMKTDIVANLILGGNQGIFKPSNLKERKIEDIPAELNRYYMGSDAALVTYLHRMRKDIEARKFFGRMPESIAKVKKAMHAAQAKIRDIEANDNPDLDRISDIQETIAGYRAILDRYKTQEGYDDNIATYVIDLINEGEVDESDENVLTEILSARFHEKGTRGNIQTYKNLSYIDTMGSPISALTQIGDLAWAAYKYGFPAALKGAYTSITKQSRITKEDVGIERIAQEFADSDTMSNAVAKVFKWVGLEKMDTIGKESLLNTALESFEKRAVSEPAKLKAEIEHIFEGETNSVIIDLANKEITDSVKLLVYSKLLDFQPAALSEMSEQYLKAGNGRIFYMLKSYTLKQFDVYRNEAYNKIKTGERAQVIEGLKNMAYLSMCLVLANAGADELKDLVLGRETSLKDRTVDNILRLFGVSKFVTWKARTEGVGSAMVKQILPPFKFIDSVTRDVVTAGDDKGLYSTASIPMVGKLAYWHLGRGAKSNNELWDRRFSQERAKLTKIKEKVEADSALRSKYRRELIRLERINSLQGQLNKRRKEVNRLKDLEKKTGKDYSARIEALEDRRTKMIEAFMSR